jgi:anti-sigma factor RsiW
MTSHELACEELVEIVTEYLERAMPEPERRRFEDHLADCEGCTTYLDQMRRTLGALGALTPESIAPEARETLLVAFRDWKR